MTNTVFAAVLLSAMLSVSAAGRAEAQIGPEAGVSLCVPLRGGVSTVELQADVSAPLSDDWTAGAFVSASRTAASYAREIRGEYGVAFRRYLTPAAPTSAFFSLGLLGGYSHDSGAFGSSTNVFPPLLATIGGGSRARITPLLTVESEIDLVLYLYYPVGFRFTVGVAVPIGRTRP